MLFRRATMDDFDAIRAITTEARHYLAAQGLDQWQGGQGNPTPEIIRNDIERGFDYLACDEQTGEALGAVAVVDEGEPDYDRVIEGGWLTESNNVPGQGPCSYLVLHRIAVADRARRHGVASFMLASCVEMARARGLTSVRLDTHPGNLPMQACFAKAGFCRCCVVLISSPLEPTKERVGFELVL